MDIGCFIAQLLRIYSFVLFARIIVSWVTMFTSPSPALAPIIRIIYDLTEPVMGFFRRFIPPMGGLDLSPIFIFIIINLISSQIC